MNTGHWHYHKAIDIDSWCGFVYCITNTISKKRYIGKKVFHFNRSLPPLKGKKRKRHIKVESDWRSYTGSSKQLNSDIDALGKDKFTFEILSLHESKSSLAYREVEMIIKSNALVRDDYYNACSHRSNTGCSDIHRES